MISHYSPAFLENGLISAVEGNVPGEEMEGRGGQKPVVGGSS